ncbi:MAG: ABC transporter permease [Bacteroidales bacterium]|nr:ABC transporter permease [Bacteroidales bacterium]
MRIDWDSYKEITESLARNRSRTLLTGFGIFWGLFMLLFLVGGSHGLERILANNFSGFATNATIIFPNRTTKPFRGIGENRRWDLVVKDKDRLGMMIPELAVVTPVLSAWNQTAEYDNHSQDCYIKGIYADYAQIEEPMLKYGRYLNETDCLQERKVCVIGRRIYNTLFPDGGNPCGTFIKIGPVFYQIVGVDISSGNISINGNMSRTALIPMPVVQKLYRGGSRVDLIAMTGKKGVKMSSLDDRIRQIVAREHRFDPTDKPALGMVNTEQLFGIVDNLFLGLNILVLLVGLGTILAGAIGVSNIMMVTVKERTTEIGIRRAIGATPRQILGQIIAESVTLTLAAGSIGIVFSVFMLEGLEKITANSEFGAAPFQISFWTAIAAAGLLAVMGVLAGLAPALRAMHIKPVDAMRDE